KRTIDLLGSLDKEDAELFKTLCGFAWNFGQIEPLIFDSTAAIYVESGLNFPALSHLDDAGLISFSPVSGYRRGPCDQRIVVHYYGTPFVLTLQGEADYYLQTGLAIFTDAGRQLAHISSSRPVDGFVDYSLEQWFDKGVIPSCPLKI